MAAEHVHLAAGSLVRLARAKARMSQAQLAARAGTSQQAIAAYEAATRQPTLPTLWRILAAAGYEPRIRLEPVEDHDATVAAWEAAQPAEDQARWEEFRAGQRRRGRGQRAGAR